MPRLFVKNRALGYVSNHVPLCVRYIRRRKANFVITCVGKAFHTYNCGNLALLSVSGSHPSDIQVLCGDAFLVYASCGNEIFAWKRGVELKHVYRGHQNPVQLLLPFGEHLISVDEESNLIVWIIKTEEVYLELNFQEKKFSISAILHPSTYTNKVLLGSRKGELQLWNMHTSKLIYTFKGWESSVLVLEQSPAVDVVAVGLSSGQIILHNLKYDETVVDFSQDWGPVTALTFRMDGPPFMISGSPAGHIVVWDLEKRRVASQLRDSHAGAVTGLQCLPNEPVFVTSSPDNSLKSWIFDQPNDSARLLCVKEGHSVPPLVVRFHKLDGKNLLSSGGDSSLRVFSTVTERFNKSMGRATHNKKAMKKGKVLMNSILMPPVTMFASESARGKQWDDIICAHAGHKAVTTWSYEKLCMGSHKLVPPDMSKKDHKLFVTSLCLSHCGNFAIIGYSSGHVHRFNMQSGFHRGMYGSMVAHDSSVRGVAVDNLNKLTVSGEAKGIIKFWHFNPKLASSPLSKLILTEGISYFCSHNEASLLAAIMEDFSLCIIDQDTRSVVRKLDGHPNRITDATFSPDARWLITASMDCLICVWDIPSGKPVEIFRVDQACTSLSFSPNGQYLATTHVDLLGIYLWSNRSLYTHMSLHPCSSPLAVSSNLESLPLVELPGALGESGLEKNDDRQDSELDDENREAEYVSPEQIADEMITYSSLAGSRWQNLLNIDIIRRKNKPKKPPEAPKSAPFFLPTIPSLDFQFDIKPDKKDSIEVVQMSNLYAITGFGNILLKSIERCNFSAALEKLKSFGPTSIDYEIGCLSPANGGSLVLMIQFLKLIEYMFQSKRDYELSQAYLGLFLKVHGRTVADDSHLREFAKRLQKTQEECWNELQEKIFFCLSVVQSLKTL